MGSFRSPRGGFSHPGEPLHLGEGRLRLGEPMTVLRPMFMVCLGRFMARFVIVCGFQANCMTCLRVSLLD